MSEISFTLPAPTPGKNPYVQYASQQWNFNANQYYFRPGYIRAHTPHVWSVVQIRLNAAMTADVANRQLYVRQRALFGGDTRVILIGYASAVITASQTANLMLSPTGVITNGTVYLGANHEDHFEIQKDSLIISGDDELEFRGSNCVAGDNIHLYIVMKYMNYELGIVDKWPRQQQV